jgi:hypothetical protein
MKTEDIYSEAATLERTRAVLIKEVVECYLGIQKMQHMNGQPRGNVKIMVRNLFSYGVSHADIMNYALPEHKKIAKQTLSSCQGMVPRLPSPECQHECCEKLRDNPELTASTKQSYRPSE